MESNKERALLIDYLKMKIETKDWHAVSDAANDLRELDARASVAPKWPLHLKPGVKTRFETINGIEFQVVEPE